MNSRDAAFAEDLNEVIKATAAEAATVPDPLKSATNGCTSGPNEIPDDESSSRKKRKRAEDEECVQRAKHFDPRSHYSTALPRSVLDRHRVPRMLLMHLLVLHLKRHHRLPSALQVRNRETHAADAVVHARPPLPTMMLLHPSKARRVCVLAIE